MRKNILCFFLTFYFFLGISQVWQADLEDGNFKNPIIYADYSDPDVVKVGDNFFMTASSFNCIPALPILHSKDLVNWEIINYAIKNFPDTDFDIPQHGNGVWAPSIRFINGYYYIYYGDPDRGIYMVKTKDPYDNWDPPILVKKAYGNIDPCPLWDDDGNVYLVHAFAHSRAGVKSLIQINKLSSDGTKTEDKGVIVFDGHKDYPTIEGPKFYKRNGYYYIFAPAGGVTSGWQAVLRSKNVYGPYEDKIVLHQGNTNINGPHQGALIELESGESWFIHFQDKEAYGRITHLQPVQWIEDWPLIGVDINNDGIGEPVNNFKKPDVGKIFPVMNPATSDEFNTLNLGYQWQWHANPKKEWMYFDDKNGFLRLYAVTKPDNYINFWNVPSLLLQKFSAPEFEATVKISLDSMRNGDRTGLIIMGSDYSYISITKSNSLNISQTVCISADKNSNEKELDKILIDSTSLYLRVNVAKEAICNFSYSIDGEKFIAVGNSFKAQPGRWIGAKVGIFNINESNNKTKGYVDIDWFRIGQ